MIDNFDELIEEVKFWQKADNIGIKNFYDRGEN